jgi:hypothetical protein
MRWVWCFILIFGCNALYCKSPELSSWQEKKLIELYSWFNTISNPENPFSKEDLMPFFTPDFVMQANNEEITHNYQQLYEHFVAFRKSGNILTVNLPLDEFVIDRENQKAAVRYTITETFQNGKNSEILVIAIWHFSDDGRLKRMNEVVFEKLERK